MVRPSSPTLWTIYQTFPLKLGETSSWGGGGGIYEKGIHRGCTVDIFIPRIVMLCKINTTQKVPPPPPPEHYVAIFH